MSWSDRLKWWREQEGLKQAEFSAQLGIPLRTYARYESGERGMAPEHFVRLAELGCDPTWLLTGEDSNPSKRHQTGGAIVQIPWFNASFSAGRGHTPPDIEQCRWVEFDADWIRRATGRNPRNLVMAQAEGNSMEPTIVDGDEMLIDVTDKRLTNGKIYALSVSEVLVVKRIHLSVSGIVRLISDNKDYEPEEISHTASAEMQVIGQVVWWSHRAR